MKKKRGMMLWPRWLRRLTLPIAVVVLVAVAIFLELPRVSMKQAKYALREVYFDVRALVRDIGEAAVRLWCEPKQEQPNERD